jgi:phosphomannomutase
MSKDKIMLDKTVNVDKIINEISKKYSDQEINNEDGLKIDFENSWVQLRKSNTEPIIRVYSEAKSQEEANMLSSKFIDEINIIK